MRRFLDALYYGAAALAALFLVALLGMVLLGIVSRELHFMVPGTDAYAGYLMAASGFLALAHTFRRGEHIRVTLIVNALRGRWRRAIELWALGAGTLLAVLFAFYAAKLAWQSWQFNDISTANDATPLWIPQLGMAVGALIFAIALLDALALEARGHRHVQTPAEALRNE